jgi:glycosyltransferase involved in cell wall biosynthesis
MLQAAAAKPLISVIITSYNYLPYITTAIDSALAQTYPNVEIVVTDNCSTDGTVPALQQRYAAEPRVRIFENERNLGEHVNSNLGLERSTGEFVVWLSADDWLYPHHLERLHQVFERAPGVDVVYSGTYFGDDAGRVFDVRMREAAFPFDYVDARNELIEMFTSTCPMCWATALFRRSVFEELGCEHPENGIVSSDWELQIRIALAGKRFAYLAEPSAAVRVHPGQTTGADYQRGGKRLHDFLLILEMYLDHPGMARLRGSEARISGFLWWMLDDTLEHGGRDAVSADINARVAAVTRVLDARAAAYEPARVHESLVSVILPVSRSPMLAQRAIDSVAAQTFGGWEIVLVDEAPFSLRDWLDAHPQRPRISYVRATGLTTAGAARNVALRMARGEYFAFLSEANTFAPEHLATLSDAIAGSGRRAAAAEARLVLEETDPRLLAIQPIAEVSVYRTAAEQRELSLVANALPLDTLMIYRSIPDRIGGFADGLPFLDDYEFVLRVERDEPLAFTGTRTVDVRISIDLRGTVGPQLSRYLTVLDAVHNAHPAPSLQAARTAHRGAVERAIAAISCGHTTVQQTAELVATLAGHAARPFLPGKCV